MRYITNRQENLSSSHPSTPIPYPIKGILFVSIAGTLAHFVYEWSNNNYILGFFFPVNESTWEHMKLFFFPMLLFSIWMNQNLKEEYPCVTGALLAGTLLGTFFIPVLFYTYSGILGKNVPLLDIATFFISVIAAFCYIYKQTLSCNQKLPVPFLKCAVLLVLLGFLLFTYHPPALGIFQAPFPGTFQNPTGTTS